MRYNANVNSVGMKNMTALLAATKSGHGETALRLLEHRMIDIKVQDKVKQELIRSRSFSNIFIFDRMVKRH
jgi:hypothetical protein